MSRMGQSLSSPSERPAPRSAELRTLCWSRAVDTRATSFIFERRARSLRWKIQVLTFSGFVGVLVLGAFVAAFGVSSQAVPYLITGAAVVTIIQIAVALWAAIAKWPEGYAYALESVADNDRISLAFRDLAQSPPPVTVFEYAFGQLQNQDSTRASSDHRVGVSHRDRRRGYRYSLLMFSRKCPNCGNVPKSMKSVRCGVCGDF